MNIGTLPGQQTTIIGLNNGANASGAYEAELRLETSGAVSLYYNSGGILTKIGSSSSALSTGQWYCLELWFDRSPASGSQIVKARIDQAAEFASATNLTINAGVQTLVVGSDIDNSSTDIASILYFDDIAINDSTGSNQTSYAGSGQIMHLRPSAAGDSTQFAIAGSTPAATNWQSVNEVPPDDAVTLVRSATVNQVDMYNIDDTPAGIGSSDTINVVQQGIRMVGATASGTIFKTQIESQASGTKVQSAALGPNTSGSWVTNQIAAPFNYPLTSYTDPQAGGAWTKALLDTAQIGYIVTTGSSKNISFSNTWLLVDWTPAVVTFTFQQLIPAGQEIPQENFMKTEVVDY